MHASSIVHHFLNLLAIVNEFNQTKELLSQALESGIQKSNDLVNEEYFERLKAHFIEHEIVLDENESNIILKKCLDDFTLNDLNKCIVKSFTDDNIVVVLCGNNMSNVITEQELASLYKKYYDEAADISKDLIAQFKNMSDIALHKIE